MSFQEKARSQSERAVDVDMLGWCVGITDSDTSCAAPPDLGPLPAQGEYAGHNGLQSPTPKVPGKHIKRNQRMSTPE